MPAESYLPVVEPTTDTVIRSHDRSRANLLNQFDWFKVAVTDYFPDKKLFRVLTLDGLQREFNVPRIYLAFQAENPLKFAQRIKKAIDLRTKTENRIR